MPEPEAFPISDKTDKRQEVDPGARRLSSRFERPKSAGKFEVSNSAKCGRLIARDFTQPQATEVRSELALRCFQSNTTFKSINTL